jgi:eukaryotic translation initiation factor 2C
MVNYDDKQVVGDSGDDIRVAEHISPARPGLGAAGTPCVVKSNHFIVRMINEGMHYYDVSHSHLLLR